jgi:hypothetical protein
MEVAEMSFSSELAALYRRDLVKLAMQLRAFPSDESLWEVPPGGGIANSGGNLALHLEGNLREYIGRQLGGVEYVRTRDREFGDKGLPVAQLAARIDSLADLIPGVVASLSADRLDETFPENVLGAAISTRQFVGHLLGHLNYHLGQIDYARRILTGDGSLNYPRL